MSKKEKRKGSMLNVLSSSNHFLALSRTVEAASIMDEIYYNKKSDVKVDIEIPFFSLTNVRHLVLWDI